MGALLELNRESDFVARTEDFQELLRDIAATDPRFVGRDKVAQADLDREKEVFLAQPAMKGKPEAVDGKILEGKMSKFYEEVACSTSPSSRSLADHPATGRLESRQAGRNISVRRFARFKADAPDWTVAQTKLAAEDAPAEATA